MRNSFPSGILCPMWRVALEFDEKRFRQVLFDTIASYGDR